MVEKIYVQPESVRGQGNIVSPSKTLTDIKAINCEVTESTESIYGLENTVYNISYISGTYDIVLSCSSQSVAVFSPVTLTAVLTEANVPVSGVNVTFKADNTSVGTAVTDSSGVATFQYTPTRVGVTYLTASYGSNDSNNVSLSVNRANPTLTLRTSSEQIVPLGDTITLTGVFSGGEGFELSFYKNQTIEQITTGTNGNFTITYTPDTAGALDLYIKFNGTDEYSSVTSDHLYFAIVADGTLDITSTKSILSYADSDSATLTAQIMDGTSTVSAQGINVDFILASDTLTNYYVTFDDDAEDLTQTGDCTIRWKNYSPFVNLWPPAQTALIYRITLNQYMSGNEVTLIRSGNTLELYIDGVKKSGLIIDMNTKEPVDQWSEAVLPLSVGIGQRDMFVFNTANMDNYSQKVSTVTDSSGQAEVTYNSQGIGDVKVQAISRSFVSKTFVIEDLYDYDLTTYNSSATSPLKLPNGNFELTYKSILKTSTAHNTNLNIYGVLDDNSTQVISVIGLAKRTGKDGFHTSFVVNGVWEEYWHSSPVTVNSEYLVKYIYNNGQHSLYVDGDLLITTSKIMKNMHNVSVGVNQNEWIKDLKVKPL